MWSFKVIYIVVSLWVLVNFGHTGIWVVYAQNTPPEKTNMKNFPQIKGHRREFHPGEKKRPPRPFPIKIGDKKEEVPEEESSKVTNRELAKDYLKEGFRASKSGDCSTSIKFFKKAIELDPTWDKPYVGMAELYFKNGRTRDAVLSMKKAIDINPDNAEYFARMGRYLIKLRDYKRAASVLYRARILAPKMAKAHFYLGVANFRMNQFTKAKRHLLFFVDMPKASRIDKLSAHRILGIILMNEGDLENARAHFEKVLKDDATPEELRKNVQGEYDSVMRQIRQRDTKKAVGIGSSALLVVIALLLFILLLMRRKASQKESPLPSAEETNKLTPAETQTIASSEEEPTAVFPESGVVGDEEKEEKIEDSEQSVKTNEMTTCPICGEEISNTASFCASCGHRVVNGGNVFQAPREEKKETSEDSQEEKPPSPPLPKSRPIPDSLGRGRYKLSRMLGAGGMGRVFLAEDNTMDSNVVVKEMLPLYATDKDRDYMVNRFHEEAKLLFRLKHLHLPRVTDCFEENESLYLIMEYVEGENLKDIAKKRPGFQISIDEGLQWMMETLDILEYLHGQEPPVLHRDIKPENIMLTDKGDIFLVDFGVARSMGTTTYTRVGTPGFASMEHFTGDFSPASDIFSLGATFHFLFSGEHPLQRKPFVFPELDEFRKDIPDGLQEIFSRMLETKSDDRYQDVKEIKKDIQVIIDSRGNEKLISN